MQDKLKVGIVASPHGLKGEVKVFPTTDDAKRYKKLKKVITLNGPDAGSLIIENLKFSGKFVILKFTGIDSLEDAQKLKGTELWIDRKDAVKLSKNEYFVVDLIDIVVIDDNNNELGKIKDVIHTGANDVYVVGTGTGKDLLLPAIKECILSVDIENRTMRVHIMEGLWEC